MITNEGLKIDALNEAEIQVLIVLIELEEPKETPNNNFYQFYPDTIEKAAKYFRKYRQNWTEAYITLASKGFIYSDDANHRLTSTGRVLAEHWRNERPPIWYWYKEFYLEAPASHAYHEFCEKLYGEYLCQQNFSDMTQIDTMLQAANLSRTNDVLDLGCGTGMLAEYVSDCTGATVHGIDYAPDAIEQAMKRTASKRERLTFEIGNMDSLAGDLKSFDTVLSIDTLYMPRNLYRTLARVSDLLESKGQMLSFYSYFLSENESRDSLFPERTPLAKALYEAGFKSHIKDVSRETFKLMQRKRLLAEEMRERFLSEGRLFLYNHLVAESVDPEIRYDPSAVRQSRYLYHSRKII